MYIIIIGTKRFLAKYDDSTLEITTCNKIENALAIGILQRAEELYCIVSRHKDHNQRVVQLKPLDTLKVYRDYSIKEFGEDFFKETQM